MASTIPNQNRVIDPFSSYNSNVVNEISHIVTQGSDGLLTTNSLQVSLDSTSPLTNVVVSTGYVVKDDVLINITADHDVNFHDVDQYALPPVILSAGNYYLVLEYVFVKSRPAPQASIKILMPAQRGLLSTSSNYFLLKVVELDGSGNIIAMYDKDPDTGTYPDSERKFVKYYAGSEIILPTFDQQTDQSRMAYESTRDKYYFGYSDGWRELSAGGISTDLNTDSTGIVVGSLCYIDSNRDAIPAIATSVETGADIVVLSIGTALTGNGRGSVAGFVEGVPVESGAGQMDIGDLLYLSNTDPGTVTNVRTSPFYQVVGRALSAGSEVSPIDMIFSPKLLLSLSIEGRIINWASEGGGLYSRQIDTSALDGTNAYDCHWFDAATHYEIRPTDVQIINNGDRVKVWMSTNTIDVDYIISAGGGAGAAGGGGGGGVTDHPFLTGLHYTVAGHTGFTPDPHGNAYHTGTYIQVSGVSFANLNANGSVGTGAAQVAIGNHTHPQYIDIPSGAILLFESDTVLSGYTLLTTRDDATVYITKGSGAGGETGGDLKATSTWTQPAHVHSINTTGTAHTHNGPSHTHLITISGYAGVADAVGLWSTIQTNNTGNFTRATVSPPSGAGGTGATSSSGTHDHGGGTVSGGTPNTWRPRGYNYTRQQRV